MASIEVTEWPAELSLKRHLLLAVIATGLLVGGLSWWSATTPIAGAVVTDGIIVVDGGTKKVQHQDGGIVDAFFVKDDDRVAAGDLLVRLNGTSLAASREVIVSQLNDALAQIARLAAEDRDRPRLDLSNATFVDATTAGIADVLEMQQEMLEARATEREQQKQQLERQIAQLSQQVVGLTAQKDSADQQLALIAAQSEDLTSLHNDGLVEGSKLSAMQRDQAQMLGEMQRLAAAIAEAQASIDERRVQLRLVDADFRAGVMKDLQDVQAQVAQLRQQLIAIDDKLSRLEIRAPISGIVHQSIVRTVGGVVSPGETLMVVVPVDQPMAIEVHVRPIDVDKVYPGRDAVVRFMNFDARTTPDLQATVQSVAPDLTIEQSGAQYYDARLTLPPSEFAKLPKSARLVAGMPVESFIQTEDRTVLSYLLEPLVEQFNRALREK